jgi:hypothetical protein
LHLYLFFNPSNGIFQLAFNSDEPPPTVIDLVAFSPMTAIVILFASIGKKLHFNSTIPSQQFFWQHLNVPDYSFFKD